jgi:hypothetical protein
MAGNADFTFLGTNTRFNYNWGTEYTFLVVNGGFGQNNGKNFFSQALMQLRNVNSLNDIVSIEEFIQFNNDKQILLLRRVLLGTGLRIKVVEDDDIIIKLGPSVFFEHETYDLDNTAIHKNKINTARINLYITSLFKLQENISFLSIIYLQPKFDEFKDLRILFDSALNIGLGKTVDFLVKLQMRYDSLPADSIKEFDLNTKMGVAINL